MEREFQSVVSSGIDKFDEILGGGFPRNSMVLFLTDIGSEAEIIVLQILWNRLKAGDLGIIYDFDLPPMELREKMKYYGWDVKKYEEEEKFILADFYTHAFDVADFYPKEEYYCKYPNEVVYVANFLHEIRGEILLRTDPGKYFGVILSAGHLIYFGEENPTLKLIYTARMKLKPFGISLLILDPLIPSEKGLAKIQNFSDVVVRFSVERNSKNFEKRLKVVKSPLHGYLSQPVPYTITPIKGLVL